MKKPKRKPKLTPSSNTTDKISTSKVFVAWVCTKYAKEKRLSFPSSTRGTLICVYDQYKIYLKNYSKKNFDLLGSSVEARRNFEHFLEDNDIVDYIKNNEKNLLKAYQEYKSNTYLRYRRKKKRQPRDRQLVEVRHRRGPRCKNQH